MLEVTYYIVTSSSFLLLGKKFTTAFFKSQIDTKAVSLNDSLIVNFRNSRDFSYHVKSTDSIQVVNH